MGFQTIGYVRPAKTLIRLRVSACAYAQYDQSLCLWLKYSLTVKLLTDHHLEVLGLKGGCTDSSESTLVKIPHCWKSHVVAQLLYAHVNLYLIPDTISQV